MMTTIPLASLFCIITAEVDMGVWYDVPAHHVDE